MKKTTKSIERIYADRQRIKALKERRNELKKVIRERFKGTFEDDWDIDELVFAVKECGVIVNRIDYIIRFMDRKKLNFFSKNAMANE